MSDGRKLRADAVMWIWVEKGISPVTFDLDWLPAQVVCIYDLDGNEKELPNTKVHVGVRWLDGSQSKVKITRIRLMSPLEQLAHEAEME